MPHTYTAYQLARMGRCVIPRHESPGAQFLVSVADDVVERIDDGSFDADDSPSEIADSAVPIYTHELWKTFVDLGAFHEDPTEIGFDGSDMEQGAKVCLYMIADRLARAIAEDYSPESSDDDDSDDTEA